MIFRQKCLKVRKQFQKIWTNQNWLHYKVRTIRENIWPNLSNFARIWSIFLILMFSARKSAIFFEKWVKVQAHFLVRKVRSQGV